MKHHPPFINDLAYIHAWMLAADRFTAINPVIEPPEPHLVERHGTPRCATCWDTGLCAECYGRYPQYCAAQCGDGICTCAAGQARRAVYQASLQGIGGRQ